MMPGSIEELARAVDVAVAATPGVDRVFATGARAVLTATGADLPLSTVSRRGDGIEASVSIAVRGDAAPVVAERAAGAAAAVLPVGSRIAIRVARVLSDDGALARAVPPPA